MIFIDTETTGLLKPTANLEEQPKIIEIGLIKTDDKLKVLSTYEQLVNPEEELEPVITKITGIRDVDLFGRPTFIEIYDELCDFFLGEKIMVGHNCPFDAGILWAALARHGLEFMFPWPPVRRCTAQESKKIGGKRLKLRDLHELATGKKHESGAHRAIADTEALLRSYKWMIKEGYFL
ncbi:MAG: 3'-5' exonuclease [Planctomycetes bacterium]|nr:3'-5' exonuclease [Planctomycetota bacterium]